METTFNEHEQHTDEYDRGVYVFVALALLSIVEFAAAIVFQSTTLLMLMAVTKAGLVIYYYMHISKLSTPDETADHHTYAYRSNTNRIGLWLFLLSDAFVFSALFIARFNLLGLSRPDLIQLLGLAVTSVLLVSSFFANRGEIAAAAGDRKRFLNSILVTIVLGVLFMVGVVGLEWPLAIHEGTTPSSGAAGAVFFMMTGMHALHVLTGVAFLAVIYRNGRRGLYTPSKHFGVEAAAVYWHFVDVVWIFFYPALYLVGRAL
jgi:cytochrome c oxidase subunit III